MSVEDQLKQTILEKYKSVRAFTTQIGVPYSTLDSVFRRGIGKAGIDTMLKVFDALSLDIESINTGTLKSKEQKPSAILLQTKSSTPEPYITEVVATKYKRLDMHGKQVVCAVISEEEKRIESEYQWQEPKAVYPLSDYLQTASAGYGDFNDDASYTVVDLVKRPPMGTSFLITINGDSMEPTYHDGDKLFIKAQETLNIGEIGLFAIGSDLYIKEYGADGLISHNPKYPIKRPEMDTIVKVYGKVLGVCTDDYFGK